MQKLWKYLFNEDTGRGITLTTIFYKSSYQKTYNFVKLSEYWTWKKIKKYQWTQLTTLLNHAYEHVPYYKKLFKTQGITPDDIKSIYDFQQLPFLTKEIVQKHSEEFKATNYPSYKFEETNTGGSTGYLLRFDIEKGIWFAKHLAYMRILLERAGCGIMDKSVQIIGREKPWEYRPFSRTLVLSSYHMTDKNLPIYLKKIKRHQPQYFIAYPSAITMLATYMKNNSFKLKNLKAIFCFGETIYEWQREYLEKIFKCRVHGQYGHREQCILAGTCEKSNFYHIFPEYGIVELIDRNDKQVTKDGEIGEIVATGFHTGIFPFIRYKTGDLASYSTEYCECGRYSTRFKSIEGRVQDFLVSKTKRLVPIMGILQLIARSSLNIKEYQLYQECEGEIILHIVKKEGFTDDDVNHIRENVQTRLGNEFSLSLKYMKTIPLTSRGKYQFLVQKIPISFSQSI